LEIPTNAVLAELDDAAKRLGAHWLGYGQRSVFRARAWHDIDTTLVLEHGLKVGRGDMVQIVKRQQDGWVWARHLASGMIGWIPSAFLDPWNQ
jgi:hypothetical protein